MKYEDKFIVINRKRLTELNEQFPLGVRGFGSNKQVLDFIDTLNNLVHFYQDNIGQMNQKYYVVNQDEPYADQIWEIIKKGEEEKERQNRFSKIKCIKDFYMEDDSKAFTSGQVYLIVERHFDGCDLIDDDKFSHFMTWEDLVRYFDCEVELKIGEK